LLLPLLLVCTAVGVILFWRRSEDWVAIVFSLALLVLGGTQFVFAVTVPFKIQGGSGGK
jgi:hypothetical protein